MEGKLNCKCIEKLDKALEPMALYAMRSIMFDFKNNEEADVILIELGKYDWPKGKDRRPKPPRIVANFCPMCGTKTGTQANTAGVKDA